MDDDVGHPQLGGEQGAVLAEIVPAEGQTDAHPGRLLQVQGLHLSIVHDHRAARDAAHIDGTVEERHVVGRIGKAGARLLVELDAEARRRRSEEMPVLEDEGLAHQAPCAMGHRR